MTAPLTYLKVFSLIAASTLLIACHSSSSSGSSTPDINTLHIYTTDQTIFSFNENTGRTTERGKFDTGEKKFLELNLDEDKQGYEYAVYVSNNAVYLLNYDKAVTGPAIKLAEIGDAETICGLIPVKSASKAGFTDQSKSNRSTLDLPIVSIEYKHPSHACDLETNTRDNLNFTSVIEDANKTEGIIKKSGKSESVIGGLIIDYKSSRSDDTTEDKGSIGFLGQDLLGEKIVFNYKIDADIDDWRAEFMPSSGIQTILQASNNQALVQYDEQIFVLNTSTLFSVNKASSAKPVQDRINAMFEIPTINLGNPNPVELNHHQNVNTFLMKHDNTLYYYEAESLTQIPSNEPFNVPTKIAFDLTSDNTAIFVQDENGQQELFVISTKSGSATSIIQAKEIQFYIIENELYVNTLEADNSLGWQAHRYVKVNNRYTAKTYNNSRFLFMNDLDEKYSSVYLLSSNSATIGNPMIEPALYKYDSSQTNGRKKGNNTNNVSVDFLYGQFSTNVSGIVSSVIINDIFGKITLKGTIEDADNVEQDVEEYYYFNPSQALAEPNLSEQSLQLMSRKVL